MPRNALRKLDLVALVPQSHRPLWMSTEEALEMFALSDARALRKWHPQGLPFSRDRNGTIRYPMPDAGVWVAVRRYLMAVDRWRGGTHLSMERAWRIEMHLQAGSDVYREPMVLVPLHHDHPARERMLRMACEGASPPSERVEPQELTDADLDTWEPVPEVSRG